MKDWRRYISWTRPYWGVEHMVGIAKRYQITITNFGPYRPEERGQRQALQEDKAMVRFCDMENHPFTRGKEFVGTYAGCRRAAMAWAKEPPDFSI